MKSLKFAHRERGFAHPTSTKILASKACCWAGPQRRAPHRLSVGYNVAERSCPKMRRSTSEPKHDSARYQHIVLLVTDYVYVEPGGAGIEVPDLASNAEKR